MFKTTLIAVIAALCINIAGFKAVQSFWQNHLFIGAIAIK